MKFGVSYMLSALLIVSICYGQTGGSRVYGKVTFITSQNVYVKFGNTEDINVGDTLYALLNKILPCLVVKNKSSMSCVTETISGCDLKKDYDVFYYAKERKNSKKSSEDKSGLTKIPVSDSIIKFKSQERITARLSANGYSNLSSARDDNHGMMYSFSLNADHIRNSKFSLETYINYRHNFIARDETNYRKSDLFNVYSAAIRYDVLPSFSLVLGRKININAGSVGAVDGLQAEKSFNKFFTGLMVGFRPDMFDYGFNKDLFQYNCYIGVKTDNHKSYSVSTLGYHELRNHWKVDRRYVFFQHSSAIRRKLSFFSSGEIDLYKKENGKAFFTFRPVNLYVFAMYRMNRVVDFSVSYDSRKQTLYFETFKDYIDKGLYDDEARQGLQGRATVRPYKYINIGVSYTRRFQSSGHNKSDNINGYVSWSKVVFIGGRLSAYFNMNISNYLTSKTITFRYSRYWFKNRISTDLYFRRAYYDYLNYEISDRKNYYGMNITAYITPKISASVMGEVATGSLERNYRIYASLIARFEKRRKN